MRPPKPFLLSRPDQRLPGPFMAAMTANVSSIHVVVSCAFANSQEFSEMHTPRGACLFRGIRQHPGCFRCSLQERVGANQTGGTATADSVAAWAANLVRSRRVGPAAPVSEPEPVARAGAEGLEVLREVSAQGPFSNGAVLLHRRP